MKMTNNYYVYDTSALLERVNNLFEENENIIIPSIVFEELDKIKDKKQNTNIHKLIKLLNENKDKYTIIIFKSIMEEAIYNLGFWNLTPDLKILAVAIYVDKTLYPDNTIFVTNDLNLQIIANLYFGEDSIISVEKYKEQIYTGIKEICVNEKELAHFYENLNNNIFNLNINQYLILKDLNNNIIDKYCWTGQEHRVISFQPFNSRMLGELKPKKNDIYQMFAFDSVQHNQITLLTGPPGTGKSIIAINYLVSLLEKNKIDKIIIFCNPIATLNSARLGFYPGDRNTKLLDSQIGNFLYSKFGGEQTVNRLIEEDRLLLLPLSDIRGYDTTGLHAGIYITEAQNMDIPLMKLALQRIGEDSVVVIDGDCETQVDDKAFAGERNGMKRLSKVFRGQDIYGEVKLQNIHRSKIATIAEQM